jgi:hypothetical protein
MSGTAIVIDTGAIINLFTAGGEAAWDMLIAGGRKLIVSDAILRELNNIPRTISGQPNPNFELRAKFDTWIAGKANVAEVNFSPPGIDINASNAGDDTLEALLKRGDQGAKAALTAATLPHYGDSCNNPQTHASTLPWHAFLESLFPESRIM